jgi:hypothetical protein
LKNSIYLENTKKTIREQVIWSNIEGRVQDPIEFLDAIIKYCEKLKLNPPEKKKSKTRQGSGRK